MRSTDFVSEYRAAGKVSVAGTIKLGNQFKDTYQVVNTPISHLYEVRIDDSPRESYPSYYFYNKDTGACVGSFSINAMPDAADDASPIVRPGVQIVQPHMTLAPEVQGKGLGSLIYDTFLAGGNWLFATFDHSSGAGALWDRMAAKGSNISVLYNFNSDTVVEPGTKQAQTAVRILGPKERFKNKQGVAEGTLNEYRNALYDFVKSKFPNWPEYVLKDFLYAQAKGIRDQEELNDFLERNQKDLGQVKWRLEKLPITLDIFTPKTQRMIKQRAGGSSNPYQVPKDAERHAQQLKMIQQQGVRTEPIIVAKLNNGYDLIEGWHRTIQHLQQYPEGYTGPAWVAYGATYTSESKQGVAEDSENYGGIQLSLEIEKDDEYVDDDTDNQTIYVKATANGRELGHVLFTIDYDGQGMVLNPQDLEVEEKYRGQGVAETMYDYVKSKGYRIRRSGQQTDAGAAFWNKHKPGQNVWEQDELKEGWKDWVAGGAMALGAMGAQANSIVSQLVEPGDTVYSIARQNNVHPSVLYKLNGFNNNTKLTPGQEVKVPDVYTQTAKPAAKAPTAKPAIAQGVRGAVARANALRPVAKAQPKAAPAAKTVAPITGSKAEQLLMNTAVRSGITGTELAAFMAQMAHESDNFKSMKEYGGSLDFRKYDPKYAPKKAKTLGNKYAGDGNRFKGRGFIQITGRYNYRIASKAIGVDLVKNPKLAEDPAVAAKIAVWYWKLRVQPNVTNWNDVEAVTKPINPGMRGLEDRKENFADYITAMATVDKAV